MSRIGNSPIKIPKGVTVTQKDQTLSVKGFAQALGSYSGTVTFASAPEPATWGLMILGFGAVGYSLRRRRALTLVPAKA